jgi:hypothetical protein
MASRLPVNRRERDPERGAIAIVMAVLWTTLFGFAAFAIDIGYGYVNKRSLKTAADAAVSAAMKTYATSDRGLTAQATATARATAMASANQYTTGVTVSYPTSPNRLQVDIQYTQPTFFLKLFGFSSKIIHARSAGEILATAGPAIHANGGCASQGLTITGNSAFVITGNVQSNGPLTYMTGPTIDTTNGSVRSPCLGYPSVRLNDVITGGVSNGGPFANPFAAVTTAMFPACTYGTLLAPFDPPYANWSIGAGPGGSDTLAPGVYCSGGDMNVTSPGISMFINAPNVTFVALGRVQLGANNGANLSPAPGSPGNILLYTSNNTSCSAGQAINIGFNNFTFNGSVYAPNGCIRAGGKNMRFNGSLVANEIFLAPDPLLPSWNITGGGGGGPTWRMYQ